MSLAIERASIGTPLNSGTTSTTAILTTDVSVAPGSQIEVIVYGHTQPTTVTDNSGNGYVWTKDKEHNNNLWIAVFRTIATAGLASGTVITATYASTSNTRFMCGSSFSGGVASSPLDAVPVSQSYFGAGGTPPIPWVGPTLTPGVSPTIVFGIFAGIGQAGQSSTPTSPWIQLFDLANANNDHLVVMYQIVTGLTARTPGGQFAVTDGAEDEAGITLNYKEGVGGGLTYHGKVATP